MPEKKLQEYLFQQIKETLAIGESFVDAIAEVLHISQDSAYRRIRGETLLVLEEAKTLCLHYNISLDQLLQRKPGSIVFQNVEIDKGNNDFEGYLKTIVIRLKKMVASQQKSILYLTKDIPLFHQFCFRPVIAFRYFFWMKTMFQHPRFAGERFSFDCLPASIETLGNEILSLYNSIPSTEIWNTEGINSILLQISYYLETGIITKQEAAVVYEGLEKTIEHLQKQSEHGRKFLPGENPQGKKDNYQLFYNRVMLGDTTILASEDEQKTVYLNYDVLNYLASNDEVYCNQVYHRLQNIMRRSTLISSVSEKQRNMFFNQLYARLPHHTFRKENSRT